MNFLQKLLENGPAVGNVDSEGHSLLCIALRRTADESIIQALIDKGYSLDSCRRHPTALFCALDRNPDVWLRKDLVKLLLENGVDLGENDKDDVRPLQHALRFGYYETGAIELIFSNVVPHVTYPVGLWKLTPLHCAVLNPHCQDSAVEFLIKKGEDVDVEDRTKSTPLHLAVTQPFCRPSIVKLLLEKNHSRNSGNMSNETPLKACLKAHHDYEIANVLLAAGCFLNPNSITQQFNFLDLAFWNADNPKLQLQEKIDYIKRLTKYALFIKMDCISESALKKSVKNRALADYAGQCLQELNIMKSLKFNKDSTLYKFLRDRIPLHEINGNPPAAFDINELKDLLSWNYFPIYHDVIIAKAGIDPSTESILYAER